MAHPPAISAAPISASRWRFKPVKARVSAGGLVVTVGFPALGGVPAPPFPSMVVSLTVPPFVTTPLPPEPPEPPVPPEPPPVPPVPPVPPAPPPPPDPPLPPDVEGPESAAPSAGLVTKISGTTQAAAPAPATAEMRPSAWRLEIRFRSKWGSPGERRDPASPCIPSFCMTTAPHSPRENYLCPPQIAMNTSTAHRAVAEP
jgi:hypothetical protein